MPASLRTTDSSTSHQPERPHLLNKTLCAHALLAAVVCSLPHWAALLKNKGDYTPFSVSPQVSALVFDETHAYAPPARRFFTTGRLRAETDNFEHRNFSAAIPFVPVIVLGAMGSTLGSLGKAFIAADIIFPALLFLLLFSIAHEFAGEQHLALFLTWCSLLIPFGLLNSVWLGDDALIAPLEVTRTPQPELSFLILLAAAALLALSLKKDRTLLWASAAGIASGLVVYSYYFYALAWGFALALILLFGLVWKSRNLVAAARTALLWMSVSALPYLRASIHGKAEGGQTDLLERMGAYTHHPAWLALFLGILLAAALLTYGRPLLARSPCYLVLAAVVAGCFFGMNFQLLTGYETQSWHFWKRLALPLAFFLLLSAAASFAARHFAPRWPRWRGALTFVTFLLIAETSARLICAGVLTAPYQRASRPEVSLLTWVRSHISPNHVIGSINPELILLIPALTANYTYVPSGLRSLTSTDEIKQRYFEMACLLGLSTEGLAQAAALPNHLAHSSLVLQVLGLSYTGDRSVYQAFLKEYAAQGVCRVPRRLDYLAVSKEEAASPSLQRFFPARRVVYQNAAYELIAVHGP